jgi:hypothetical protein
VQPCSIVHSDTLAQQQGEWCLLYLKMMKGLCFNCLARDHKVAFCHDPTKCWRCHQFGHISTKCHLSSLELTLTQNSRGNDNTVDDSLLHFRHNSSIMVHERLRDPMLLEALLINQRKNGGGAPPHQSGLLLSNTLSTTISWLKKFRLLSCLGVKQSSWLGMN